MEEAPASADNKAMSPAHSNVSDDLFSDYQSHMLKKYLQFSFGYLNSRYEKIHPTLDNGSALMSFKFVADVSARVQTGFSVEILSDNSGQTVPDNIRVLQYRIFADYHAPLLNKGALKLDWVAGFRLFSW